MRQVFLLLFSLLVSTNAIANFFDTRVFSAEDGLSGAYIYSLTQDRDGFLWIGTENGIYRYDGQEFKGYLEKDSLPDAYTASYVSPNDGYLYFGQSKGAIIKWDGRSFIEVAPASNTASGIKAICEASDLTMWFLTQNNGLISKKSNGDEVTVHTNPELAGLIAYSMTIFNDILYIGTSDGLFKFDIASGTPQAIGSVEELDYVTVRSIQPRRFSKGFWVGTEGNGLYLLNASGDRSGKHKDICIRTQILQTESIVAIGETEERDLWLGTSYRGLYKINFNYENSLPALYSHFNTKTRFPGNQIGAILVDNEETAWAGTLGDGMAQLVEKSLHYFSFKQLGATSVNATIQNRKHEMFFGTDQGMVKGYYGGQSDSLRFQMLGGEMANTPITSLSYAQDSSFIIGTKNKGVFLADEEMKNIRPLPIDVNYASSPIRAIEVDLFGNIWVSISGNGIFKFDKRGIFQIQYATTTGFYHNEVYALLADREGNVWTGAHSSGLAVIKVNGSVDLLTKEKIFPSREINDITMDRSGNIWIATYGNGLFEYDGENFVRFNQDNGLMSDYCSSVIADQDDHIWVGHRKGMSRVDESDLSISQITKKQGLQEVDFLMGSAFADWDHNLWIGNLNGVTFLSLPHKKFTYRQLKTEITNIRLFYEEIDMASFTSEPINSTTIPDGLEFNYDQNELTFDYIAINLREPAENLYEYRLIGYDSEWSPPTSQTNMTYTNLDPGEYTFEVRHSNHREFWSEDNIYSASFIVNLPYWETWWFSSGEIAFLVLLVSMTFVFSKNTSNRFLIKFMIYVSLFITFEYIHTQLEPYLEHYAGGAPIFQVLMHTILGLILFPVETIVSKFIYKRSGAVQGEEEV